MCQPGLLAPLLHPQCLAALQVCSVQVEHACLHEADARLVCWQVTQECPPPWDLQDGTVCNVLQASYFDKEGTVSMLRIHLGKYRAQLAQTSQPSCVFSKKFLSESQDGCAPCCGLACKA